MDFGPSSSGLHGPGVVDGGGDIRLHGGALGFWHGLDLGVEVLAGALADIQLGEEMGFWRHNMPQGMLLRSSWVASSFGGAKARRIVVGKTTSRFAEVRQGLRAGERVRIAETEPGGEP